MVVLFWANWGALSALPASVYHYPDEMIYSIWALTMIIPAAVALRNQRFDRRRHAAAYGLLNGLTGAGGQLLLFQALTMGPAYLIFPIVAVSPAVTVLLAVALLRERMTRLAAVGLIATLVALVSLSITDGDPETSHGPWLVLAIVVCVVWGLQTYLMRKAATRGINDATTFGWMAISGVLLIPVALASHGGVPTGFPWQAPVVTAGIQLLNSVGTLFLVMALSRGKATKVAPTANVLSSALTAVISLAMYRTLPTAYGAVGIVLALTGSALMYRDEERGRPVTEGANPENSGRVGRVATE
jgi:drug/metabolite transporter (DMT)-like permease